MSRTCKPVFDGSGSDTMPLDFSQLNTLCELHNESGSALFAACTAELFPCDVLAFSVLERSLNLIKGFRLIVSSGGYSSGVGLLRMQLDNLLRFNGVVLTRDPHEVAYKVITGIRLSRLKDKSGAAMNDKRLVELLAKKNPWVEQVESPRVSRRPVGLSHSAVAV